MPDLSNCKQIKGKLYCWDKQLNDFVEVRLLPVKSLDVYKALLLARLQEDNNLTQTKENENGTEV
jgi:hypothetical protein